MAALDLESRLRVVLASVPQNVHSVPMLSVSHPALSKTWHLWREPRAGRVTLDDGAAADVLCINFEASLASSEGGLDQRFDFLVDTTDPQNTFRNELDRIPMASEDGVVVNYREYLSDDFTAPVASIELEVESCGYALGAATLVAVSPRLNVNRTGDLYAPREIPMLRGFK